MLKRNFLKEKLSAEGKALGTWSIIDSPMVVDIIASSGVDFLIIDAEHGAVDYQTAQVMGGLCESYGVSPVMRVGEVNESLILRALDIGMHGVQVPNISTRDDAIQLVKFAKYPPWGMRGFSPYTKAGLYDFSRGTEMPHLANNNTLVIANVEGTEGIKNLPAICSVANLDIVFIGLFDLSKSLGLPGQVEHPDVLEALEGALDTIKQNGKYSGSIASNFRMLDKLKGYDIDYVTYSVDTGMLKETYQKVVSAYSE